MEYMSSPLPAGRSRLSDANICALGTTVILDERRPKTSKWQLSHCGFRR